MSWICLLLRRSSWNVCCVTLQGKMQQFLQRSRISFIMWCPLCLLRKKKKEYSLLQPKFCLGNEGLGEMGTEWTSSFWLSLHPALWKQLYSNSTAVSPCTSPGMSWRRIMLTSSLYFWCHTGVGFGGWLENRNRSQGAQEMQTAKANCSTAAPHTLPNLILCLSYCCLESKDKTFQTTLRVVR